LSREILIFSELNKLTGFTICRTATGDIAGSLPTRVWSVRVGRPPC
jgi:hypothetical protein